MPTISPLVIIVSLANTEYFFVEHRPFFTLSLRIRPPSSKLGGVQLSSQKHVQTAIVNVARCGAHAACIADILITYIYIDIYIDIHICIDVYI
jgi:hypothetical protein